MYMYWSQIEVVNQFLNNKNIWYPLRKELKLDSKSWMDQYRTNLFRRLLLADKSISVHPVKAAEGSDDESDDESIQSIMLKINQEKAPEPKIRHKIDLDNSNPDIKKPTFILSNERVVITTKNYQLVLSVLRSLKHKSAPVEILEFLLKIISNLGSIEFRAASSSQQEKLKHLFYYKLFRYTGYAFKYATGMDEVNDDRGSTPSDISYPDSELIASIKSGVEKFVSSTIDENIKDVIKDPKGNNGSIGWIAGFTWVLKYLSNSVVNGVVSSITSSNYLKSENFTEVLPLWIWLIENFDDKFSESEREEMINTAAKTSKIAKRKSK